MTIDAAPDVFQTALLYQLRFAAELARLTGDVGEADRLDIRAEYVASLLAYEQFIRERSLPQRRKEA